MNCHNCNSKIQKADIDYQISVGLQHNQTKQNVLDLIEEWGTLCRHCERERGALESLIDSYDDYENYPI